jgi:hypothetical protein
MSRIGVRIEFGSTWPGCWRAAPGTCVMFRLRLSAGSPDGSFFLGLQPAQ